MATSPEILRPIEGEAKVYHEELHADFPEQRDSGVDQWYRHRDRLDQYDPAELESARQEFENIPEVADYDQERVTLEAIGEMMSQAAELTPSEEQNKLTAAELTWPGLVAELENLIDHYTDTVRRHQRLSIMKFHDPEKYLAGSEQADKARHHSHESLMGHIHAMSRFLTGLPGKIGSGFNQPGWDDLLRRRWFSHDEMTTARGRKEITSWALRMDIVRKARVVEAAIDDVLEKKNAERGESSSA